MKKVIIAVMALVGFNAATFAQAVPVVNKTTPAKIQLVKKQTATTTPAKVVALNKVTTPTAKTVTPAAATKAVALNKVTKQVSTTSVTAPVAIVAKPVTKAVAVPKTISIANTNSSVKLKKDGTVDKRFKANTNATAGPLKKDGTPDMRYKANKK